MRTTILPRASLSFLAILLLACGGDRSGDQPGGPAPVRPGDPDDRLADTGEIPLDLEDDCGLEGAGLDPDRAAATRRTPPRRSASRSASERRSTRTG